MGLFLFCNKQTVYFSVNIDIIVDYFKSFEVFFCIPIIAIVRLLTSRNREMAASSSFMKRLAAIVV